MVIAVRRHRARHPKAGSGRPPIGLQRKLCIHFAQHGFNLTDMTYGESPVDSANLRRFVGIDLGSERVPDSTTMTKSLKLLNDNKLSGALFAQICKALQARSFKVNTVTIVNATMIGAPSLSKNAGKARDPAMHQARGLPAGLKCSAPSFFGSSPFAFSPRGFLSSNQKR